MFNEIEMEFVALIILLGKLALSEPNLMKENVNYIGK
jgi:hypothetical protein